jgi:hypothetical protein
MIATHFDSGLSEPERRQRLYAGDLFVYSATERTRAFCEFAAGMVHEVFGGLDPQTAQHQMPVDRMVEVLKELKPRFIHHAESKRHLEGILEEFGCHPDDTHYDVPRMRSSTSDDYLTSGIAYAWHPHRDTWYSAPLTQINWWLPIFPITEGNGMCFYPEYFDIAVPNDSAGYDYKKWNEEYRYAAADQVEKDTRPLPGSDAQIDSRKADAMVVPPSGLLLFSGAHLHASVPNFTGRTRFSIDFRTASLADTRARQGAPDLDVACTWSAIRDFKRLRDRAEFPDDVASELEHHPWSQRPVS